MKNIWENRTVDRVNILDLTNIREGKSIVEIISRENTLKQTNTLQGRHSEQISSLKGKYITGEILSRVK